MGRGAWQVAVMGSQRVRHNWAAEHNIPPAWKYMMCCENCKVQYGWNGVKWGPGLFRCLSLKGGREILTKKWGQEGLTQGLTPAGWTCPSESSTPLGLRLAETELLDRPTGLGIGRWVGGPTVGHGSIHQAPTLEMPRRTWVPSEVGRAQTWVWKRRLHFLSQSLSWNALQVFSFDCWNNPASCTLSRWSVGGNSVSEMLNNFPKVIWEEPGFIARSVGILSHREMPSTHQFPLRA